MKEKLKEFCHFIGIEYVGVAPPYPSHNLEQILKKRIKNGYYTGYEEKVLAKRIDPRLTMPDVKSIIVCLFPYFTGKNDTANLSKSAFSQDYHIIVREKLKLIGEFLKNSIEGFAYKEFVDTGPLVDRYLAYSAGLGFFGINNLIINDKYGSYVFIGYILTNYPFEYDKPLNKTCMQCGRCIKYCPGGAILGNFELNPLKCRSYITQKKKELSAKDAKILSKDNLVYGCDICQDVCPHNKDIKFTNIKEFSEDLMQNIDYKDIKDISNREFLRRYGKRTFGWVGRKTILRNIEILDKDSV